MDIFIVALIGYILGGVLRTTYDYLWKIMEVPELIFDKKFVATMIIAIVITIISALVVFPTITVYIHYDTLSWTLVSCIGIGFMANHLINKPVSYLAELRRARKT